MPELFVGTPLKASTHVSQNEALSFEKSSPGKKAYRMPPLDVPALDAMAVLGSAVREHPAGLPELSEIEIVRHFTRLSTWNYAIDLGMYPLGSCTMKYNGRVNELVSRLEGIADAHPYQPESLSQGVLEIMDVLSHALIEITGMDAITLQPAAGAHGEFTGILMIRAYHEAQGNARKKVLIPDSAHGTNPATAAVVGYQVANLKSNPQGMVDVAELEKLVDEDTAALMLTNPSTIGVFESDIARIAAILHAKGALLYMDGANMNALVGKARPGDFGVDVMHLNLHKTFSTPHGGGGPGSGPVACKAILEPFLPTPVLVRRPASRPGAPGPDLRTRVSSSAGEADHGVTSATNHTAASVAARTAASAANYTAPSTTDHTAASVVARTAASAADHTAASPSPEGHGFKSLSRATSRDAETAATSIGASAPGVRSATFDSEPNGATGKNAQGPGDPAHGTLTLDFDRPQSVGRVRAFVGNFGMFVRALAYILANGPDGLRQTTEDAVLNANYIRAKLDGTFDLPFKTPTLHEVVFSDRLQSRNGVKTGDMGKRMIDYGFHAYTTSFPLIVPGAMMIEPTESESREELDLLIDSLKQIAREAAENPELVKSAPHTTRLRRLDETAAARKPILRWKPTTSPVPNGASSITQPTTTTPSQNGTHRDPTALTPDTPAKEW